MARQHVLRVRLNDEELAALDAAANVAGLTRARLLRRLIATGSADAKPVPSRREALALLAAAARAGNVQAMVALERSLRLGEQPPASQPAPSGPVRPDELRRALRVVQ